MERGQAQVTAIEAERVGMLDSADAAAHERRDCGVTPVFITLRRDVTCYPCGKRDTIDKTRESCEYKGSRGGA